MNARPRIMVVGGSAASSRAIERANFGPCSHMAGLLADDALPCSVGDVVGGTAPGVQLRAAHCAGFGALGH